jgi:hypothetical protein
MIGLFQVHWDEKLGLRDENGPTGAQQNKHGT